MMWIALSFVAGASLALFFRVWILPGPALVLALGAWFLQETGARSLLPPALAVLFLQLGYFAGALFSEVLAAGERRGGSGPGAFPRSLGRDH